MRIATYAFSTILGLALTLIPGTAFGQVKVVNMIPNSLSAEAQRDSEPNVAANPANPIDTVNRPRDRGLIAQVIVLVPSPVTEVAVTPLKLLTLAEETGPEN